VVFNGVDSVESGTQTADILNEGAVEVANAGTEVLEVTGLSVSGPFELIDGTLAGGFTLQPGESQSVGLRYTSTADQQVDTGSLTIASNDADEATTVVTLAGYNQPVLESGTEPSIGEILQVFGYQTDIGTLESSDGDAGPTGSEVASAYWQAADPNQDVTVTQIAAYTGPRDYEINWFAQDTTATQGSDLSLNALFAHAPSDSHTLLPTELASDGTTDSGQLASASFTASGPFGFAIEWNGNVDYSDAAFQTIDKNAAGNDTLMRFFPLVDENGTPVPDTYLLMQDYQGVNFDWNDNVYIVSNIQPAGTVSDTPPTANADAFDTAQAQTVFIPFAELLANDSDPDGDPADLTVVDVAGSSSDPNGNGFSDNGALITIVEEGIQALYGPPTTTFTGLDTFSYTIEDADGNQATGTVTVEVTAPIVGDDQPNVLTGTDKTEKFFADAGNDQVDAGGGDDIVFGFTGDDVINGGPGNDKLDGEGGDDQIDGGEGLDFLYGGFGVDLLRGGADTDALFGQEGDDQLFGEAGGDSLDGGDGNDFLSGGTGVDWLYGQAGADQLRGGGDVDALFGGGENDQLFGDAGGDNLDGGEGDDVLSGGTGVDYLYGQAGNDRLDGGADLDALFGGAGSDTFVMAAGNDEDQVFDFEDGVDQIDASTVATSFAGLSVTAQANNALVTDTDSDAQMLLINVAAADVDESDFVFGSA
jgi:Ca2+-binding RTX toxin-like protein